MRRLSSHERRFTCGRDDPLPLKFKAEVVALVRRGDRSIPQISKDMDLVESVIRRWVVQADVDEGRRPGTTSAKHEEIIALP
jgi:transposase